MAHLVFKIQSMPSWLRKFLTSLFYNIHWVWRSIASFYLKAKGLEIVRLGKRRIQCILAPLEPERATTQTALYKYSGEPERRGERECSECCCLPENSGEAESSEALAIVDNPLATGHGSYHSSSCCIPPLSPTQSAQLTWPLLQPLSEPGTLNRTGPCALLLSCQPSKRTPAFHSLQGKCEFFPWGYNLPML